MPFRRILFLCILLFAINSVNAQVTSYVGLSGNSGFSKVRAPGSSSGPVFGGTLSYILWEYREWYFRSGLGFTSSSSEIYEIPKYFDVSGDDIFTKTDITFRKYDLTIPIQAFVPIFTEKEHSIILMAGLELNYALSERYLHDQFGSTIYKGPQIDSPVKIAVMAGPGYQYKFDELLYLNIYPTYSMEVRSDKPFNSIELTIELIYGVF